MRRRRIERAVRAAVLIGARWLASRGRTLSAIAAGLGLRKGTLKAWKTDWNGHKLVAEPVGRPAERGRALDRNEVLAYITALGGEVSGRSLRKAFPLMAGKELDDLKRRWRKLLRKKKLEQLIRKLRFTEPGTVWAMDFAQMKRPVDGLFRYVLAVRDLASGKTITAMPVERKDSRSVWMVLSALFLWYPPPLVLKSDNEKSFKTDEVTKLLEANGVLPLYSPPYYPPYNGACETGIGTLKTFAFHASAARGCPGDFTSDDVFAAVCRANHLTRPHGHDGPTPDEAWREGTGVLAWDRERFSKRYEVEYRKELEDRDHMTLFDLDPVDKEDVDRAAMGRALIKCGFLCVKRRRVYSPV
jgi:transposase InsO family protein